MTFAASPSGPWSKPQIIATPECNTPPASSDLCLDSNFNGMIFPNGSVLAIGRQAVYTAANWRDTSSYRYSGASGMAGEDPSIWLATSPAGVDVLHMLRHTGRNTTGATGNFGHHFFSTNFGKDWQRYEDELAYPCNMTYTDAQPECMIMRERPHLVFGKNSTTPLALLTGAMRGPYAYPQWLNARSFTLLQKIAQ
jgi:hypothetical protein